MATGAVPGFIPSRHGFHFANAWPSVPAFWVGVGLVRSTGLDPLRRELGHQVVGFRYEEAADRVRIGIYDPNHPGDDTVELAMAHGSGGALQLSQSTGEPLAALLSLPYVPPSMLR